MRYYNERKKITRSREILLLKRKTHRSTHGNKITLYQVTI